MALVDQESLSPTSRLLFRSIRNRLDVAEERLKSVNASAEKLEIRSPVDGQIEQTLAQPYQAVLSGQPLMTVVPNRGSTIVVYAKEGGFLRPFPGMPVVLRSRVNPNQQVEAVVQSVGPKVEGIPQRHLNNTEVAEWGRPMRIRIPDSWIIEPGSLVDVLIVDQAKL